MFRFCFPLLTFVSSVACSSRRPVARSLCGSMFSWGQDAHRGFRLKDGAKRDSGPATDSGLRRLELGYRLAGLSAGRSALAFVKTNGNAFVVVKKQSGGGKQKFVKCKEKIQAVGCHGDGNEVMVLLLSEEGKLFRVDTHAYNPKPLEALCNIPVSQVACGSQHSVALTKGGQVYTWGQNSRGQLGLGSSETCTDSPRRLGGLSALPLVQVAAGGEQSFALCVSGAVLGWGRNHRGQLGLGDTTDRHTATAVHCLNKKSTIHISCGKDHTAILTKNGDVFTFGSGQYGQLGHNLFGDELRPRLVAELWGAKVTKIACGWHHTLALTESKRVYSFGCGEQGQLGHGKESHPSVPLPVQLLQDATDAQIGNIFAGENCSFATCAPTEGVHEEANDDAIGIKTQRRLTDMIDKWTLEYDSKTWKKIKKEIHRTFSSASCLNTIFLEQSKDKHFQTSPKYSGLNLSVARLSFEKLVKRDNVFAEVEASLLDLLPSLNKKPLAVEGLRIYLLLNELLFVIQRHKRDGASTTLAKAVAASLLNLSVDSLQVIGDWWSSLPLSTMVEHVNVWKQALSAMLSSMGVSHYFGARNLVLVLQHMYNVNSRKAEPQKMPETDFCLLIDKEFLQEDLYRWILTELKSSPSQPLILCRFPFLMDLQSKKFVFDLHADSSRMRPLMLYMYGVFSQPASVELTLSRASILNDTFEQLSGVNPEEYKLPLLIYFEENDTVVNDLDLYKKDFFHEVFHEMMSAESGMFMFNDSKTLAWFPSKATEVDERYFYFGVLCGLALYNQCVIHLPFPLALFKKLLGVKPSLSDLIEFSPCVGESLLNILEDYEDDDIQNLYRDFVIHWDDKEVDLDTNNPGKPLTGQNKKEFVDAYVNHAFNTSVDGVFQDFKQGFFQVCNQDLVKLFRPEELQEVLVGKDFHDWEKLKQNTSYEGVYSTTPPHPTIQMFWEVFDELTEDQRRAFLWFVTGSERVPIIGLDKIKMTVRVQEVEDLCYDEYYPETHTCFSILELPKYSNKEIMHTKLTEAMSSNRKVYSDCI